MTTFTGIVDLAVGHGVAVVTLNRPQKLNAMSLELFDAIYEAGLRCQNDDEISVVILKGEGRAFSAGLDLTEQATLLQTDEPDLPAFVAQAQAGFRIWAKVGKPVIAAVHGYAIGAGLQLALAADMRIAHPACVFSAAEITLGLIPDLGGTVHLARLCGPGVAKWLTFTGKKFDGNEALRLGVINEVSSDPLTTAMDLARALVAFSPSALREAKTLIDDAFTLDIDAAFDAAGESQARLIRALATNAG